MADDGKSSGDDIIIYDSERFPTLRLLPEEIYDRKQDIPVEAVYAYIEAKHTLHIHGDLNDGQSLLKACKQVSSAKQLGRKPQEAMTELVGASLGNQRPFPDLIIAGEDNLIIPCVQTPQGPMHAPFYVEGTTASIQVMPSRDLAFSTGICILLYALDTIQLGRMPWEYIIRDGFGHK